MSFWVLCALVGIRDTYLRLNLDAGCTFIQAARFFTLPVWGNFLAIILCAGSFEFIPSGYIQDILFATGISALILTRTSTANAPKFNKFNKFMADFSYSLYATHHVIIVYGFMLLKDLVVNVRLLSLIVMILALILCLVIFMIFEKKALRLRNFIGKAFQRS